MILDRLLEYIVAMPIVEGEGEGPAQTHLARYPSPEWNLKSWSYRLTEDLRLKRALHRSRLADGGRWKLAIADRLTDSAFSFHHDADHKALLFSLLRRRRHADDAIVVLPEVGPFGFDLLIARCAGYRRFVAYDKDASTIAACRAFHHDVEAEYSVSTSASFDFDRFASPKHLIVFPDWPHDGLELRLANRDNVVRYSYRTGGVGLRQTQRRLGVARPDWNALFDAMDRLD